MPLCTVCSGIDVKSLLIAAQERHKEPSSFDSLSKYFQVTPEELADLGLGKNKGTAPKKSVVAPYRHYQNIFDTRDNADNCDFCCLIWEKAERRMKGEESRWDYTGSKGVFVYVLSCADDLDDPERTEHQAWKGRRFALYVRILLEPDGQLWVKFIMKRFSDDDPVALHLLPKVLPLNSGSPECRSKMQEWLMTCWSKHTHCHRSQESKSHLPSRILDVGSNSVQPRIYESKGEIGLWVALSYCWGGSSEFVLNEATFKKLMVGKPLEDFPATMRDAISLTRSLGIQYLWVDALCIKQDSVTDWECEAPKMSQIYSNAVLTIVAASGSSVDSGICHDRENDEDCELPWTQTVVSGLHANKIAVVRDTSSKFDLDHAAPSPENCPWAARGWTLQEDLLSWRTLTFMPSEMLWSCPSSQVWESGQPCLNDVGLLKQDIVQRTSPNLGHIARLTLTVQGGNAVTISDTGARRLSRTEIYRGWYSMLENYSKRYLTVDTDNLMAIRGLATEVQSYLEGDQYYFGLWKDDLLAGLMWKLQPAPWLDAILQPNSNSSSLPSWSWASLNNAIHWPISQMKSRSISGNGSEMAPKSVRYVELAKFSEGITAGIDDHGTVTRTLAISAPTYCGSLRDQILSSSYSKFQACFLDRLKYDREFQARHQKGYEKDMLLLKLAIIEQKRKSSTGKTTERTTWIFLVLEPIISEKDQNSTWINNEIVYRRVSLCILDTRMGIGVKWDDQSAWPMRTTHII